MDAVIRFTTQRIGALPMIVHYPERLHVSAIVKKVAPWEEGVPLGNADGNHDRQPAAGSRAVVSDRPMGAAGRPGRLLGGNRRPTQRRPSRPGPAGSGQDAEVVEAALVTKMIQAFKVQVNQIHFDLTDVELYGAYEQQVPEGQTPPTPEPAYGRTRSGRKNVKQICLGLKGMAEGDGHLPLDGSAAQSPVHERHVVKIRKEREAVERNLNKDRLTTQETVLGRLESAKARYTEGNLLEYLGFTQC